MRIFCTRCGQRIEVEDVPESAEVECASCGARIGLHSMATQPGATGPQAERQRQAGTSAELPAGRMVGGYRIEGEIGRGGMGIVYRARQVALDRPVALKVLPREMAGSAELLSRFDREAQALAALAHPRIVSIYDKGFVEGRPFFAMELLQGQVLRRRMALAAVPVAEALRIVDQALEALEAAHQKGIVHRDLKPENIMFDERGEVKVMDFGIAHLSGGAGLTRTRASMGTLHYMAPEQAASSGRVDGRADLYSAGVLLYELLTRTLPVGAFRPPSEVVRGLPPALDGIVLRALDPDPKDRLESAAAMRAAIAGAMRRRGVPVAWVAGLVAAGGIGVLLMISIAAFALLRRPPNAAMDRATLAPATMPTITEVRLATDPAAEAPPARAPETPSAAGPDPRPVPPRATRRKPPPSLPLATEEPGVPEESSPEPTAETEAAPPVPEDAEEIALEEERSEHRAWLTEAQALPPVETSLSVEDALTKAYAYLHGEGFTAVVNEPRIGLLVASKRKMPPLRRVNAFLEAAPNATPLHGVKEIDRGWTLKVIVWVDVAGGAKKVYVRSIYLAATGESTTDDKTRSKVLEALGYRQASS